MTLLSVTEHSREGVLAIDIDIGLYPHALSNHSLGGESTPIDLGLNGCDDDALAVCGEFSHAFRDQENSK
jgi:hypothetical protein